MLDGASEDEGFDRVLQGVQAAEINEDSLGSQRSPPRDAICDVVGLGCH